MAGGRILAKIGQAAVGRVVERVRERRAGREFGDWEVFNDFRSLGDTDAADALMNGDSTEIVTEKGYEPPTWLKLLFELIAAIVRRFSASGKT